ncbi:hypothetical protein PMIN03_012611 [Paraphaeosphaeria minitans]
MCCVEEPVSHVGGSASRELGVRKSESNKLKVPIPSERSIHRTARRNALRLYHASDYENSDPGIVVADGFDKLDHGFPRVNHRIHQHNLTLSLQMMQLDVLGSMGMNEHRKRESIIDATRHGFATPHQRDERRSSLMQQARPGGVMAENVRNLAVLNANRPGEESNRQIVPNTTVSFTKSRAGDVGVAHWRCEQFRRGTVACIEDSETGRGGAGKDRADEVAIGELDQGKLRSVKSW